MKKIPLILTLLTLLWCVPEARAAAEGQAPAVADEGNALASADANGGYSGQVLAMISRVWTPPPDTINRRVAVRLQIDGEGNLTQCDLMTRSDMPEMNKAACFAAKEAGNFGVPPYGMPIDVYVTFWTGKPTKNTRGGKPVEDAQKPAASKSEPRPEPKGVPVLPEGVKTDKADKAEPKPTPKGVPVLPVMPVKDVSPKASVKVESVKAEAKESPVKPSTQTRPDAQTKSPAKPASKSDAKPDAKPATSRGGLVGDADAATTPIKSSSSKATPAQGKAEAPQKESAKKDSPQKEAPRKESPRKESPQKEAAKKEADTKEAASKEPGKKEAGKSEKAGIRTDFAPYRDPRAKPEVEKSAQPTADQKRYAAEVTAWIQARIVPPAKLPPGKYTMAVTLGVGGTGDVNEAELARSSGQPVLDEAVLRLVLRMEKVAPPPDKQSRDLKLTLTVHKP